MTTDYRSPAPPQQMIPISESKLREAFIAAMRRVYLWMFFGLFLTAVSATAVVNSPRLINFIFSTPFVFLGLIIGELALVIAITAAISRLTPMAALALFFLYAAVNGLTLSVIFFAYDLGTIALAFGSAAILFGFMSVIGWVTKEDLTRWGGILLMGLIGVIAASVVNFFLASSTLDWIISYAGVALFLGLTAYDTQKIKKMTAAALGQGQEQVVGRIGVLGALSLYLDFINLFLFLLRIFGRCR